MAGDRPAKKHRTMVAPVETQLVLVDHGVATKRLNEQVRRNRERFPDDFLLQLTRDEAENLRPQNATLKSGRGQHRKYLPYAAIRQLMSPPPEPKRRKIGFLRENEP